MTVFACDDLLARAPSDIDWFANAGKARRERWILDQWLEVTGQTRAFIRRGDPAPDFLVDGRPVEIAEVFPPQRKRNKNFLKLLSDGAVIARIPPRAGHRDLVRRQGHQWLIDIVQKKSDRYRTTSRNWILLLYCNLQWADAVDWRAFNDYLAQTHPHFARIDVLHFHQHSGLVRMFPVDTEADEQPAERAVALGGVR
ncbi:MAG: hypothetical protein H6684_08625 [Deltaproteobacteria bacterium]|nr:hypothetical protein [Deltaproteobacteria bacterium]